jgi:hypothetical protein
LCNVALDQGLTVQLTVHVQEIVKHRIGRFADPIAKVTAHLRKTLDILFAVIGLQILDGSIALLAKKQVGQVDFLKLQLDCVINCVVAKEVCA